MYFVFLYRADGACRHTAAALYAIEDHDVKSVTDGPAVWVRRSTACEEADKLTNLPAIQARLDNIYVAFLKVPSGKKPGTSKSCLFYVLSIPSSQ